MEALGENRFGLLAEHVDGSRALRERAMEGWFDALIVDAEEMDLEPDQLEDLRPSLLEASVIVLGRSMPADKAVAYMRAGAHDVVLADQLERLPGVLNEVLGYGDRGWRARMRDVGRMHAQRAIARGDRQFRRLLEQAADGFFVFDARGNLVEANDRAARMLGYSRDELLTLSVRDVDAGLDELELAEFSARARSGEQAFTESAHRRKDGTTYPVEVRAVLLESEGEPLYISLARDISARRAALEQVEYLKHYDAVTGLPNRQLLEQHLQLAVSRSEISGARGAVVFVDLNRFHLVNESLGRAAGDELLCEASGRLLQLAGTMDVVGRHGADEFVVLVPDITGDDQDAERVAGELATRAHDALELPFSIAGGEHFIGASIGISLYPSDGHDAGTLLDNASAAMHASRRDDGGPWRMFAGDAAERCDRLTLGGKLRKAIAGDQLELHYQPLVDLQATFESRRVGHGPPRNDVVGVEALIRWRDPARGLVPPGEFIPVAEDTGLIQQIGDWVSREACAQARTWLDEGRRLDVAFNLSPRQLRDPNLVDRLREHAVAAGVPPECMVVEITESVAMSDSERTMSVLAELRDHGFQLALDDFGAGHSSLARLAGMPADRLKIDRSFIAGLPEDRTAATMVTAIIELADNLGMVAVAEGIETEEQLEFLAERGCRLGQGFLFSRPVPAAQVPGL